MPLIDRGDIEKEYEYQIEFIPMKSAGFVSREKPNPIDWPSFDMNPECDWNDEVEVTILRASLFFHSEQKITLGKLREFFTPKAIKLLEKDGYVKLNLNFEEIKK